MPFQLPIDYVLGMAGWLLMLALWLIAFVALRRRFRLRRKSGTKWINAGLSLGILLSTLTLVELYFAVFYDKSDAYNTTNVSKHWFARHVDPYRHTLRFSDEYYTSYRDVQEFPRTLKAGQYSLCFIGDSFTFGHGIADPADRFSDRIGAALERSHPGRFVVSNLADIGRDLLWVERVLQKLIADDLPVDTLVYVVCLNDIETFQDPESHFAALADEGFQWDSFLVRNTYFPNLVYERLRRRGASNLRNYYTAMKDAYESPAWDGMQAKFDDVRRLCTENGIDLRIAVFPFVHDLGPNYSFRMAHQRIAGHCRAIGLPVLDLLPVLEPHASERLTVNPLDPHPNERAHELAAQAIERDLLGDLVSAPPLPPRKRQ